MEEQQFELFHEDIYAALSTCVKALGGNKKVGTRLWGKSASPDKQGEKLSNCLNPNHAQKLAPHEIILILRWAHDKGCHAGTTFICRDTGYQDPQPIVIEDEDAKLKRSFIQATENLQVILSRMEQLSREKP